MLIGAGLLGIGFFVANTSPANGVGTATRHTTPRDLQQAIDAANPGDVLILASGTYTDVKLNISTDEITVTSDSAGSVTFDGSSQVKINANKSIFSGFRCVVGNESRCLHH